MVWKFKSIIPTTENRLKVIPKKGLPSVVAKRFSCTSNKGIALILVYLLIFLLAILLVAFFSMSIQSMKEGERRQNRFRAFYAAESAIDLGIVNLPARYSPMPDIPIRDLGDPINAQCQATIMPFPAGAVAPFTKWIVSGKGSVPGFATTHRVERETRALVELSDLPDSFYGNALYSAGDLAIVGNAYSVNGDAFYDSNDDFNVQHPGNISGDVESGQPVDFLNGGDLDYKGLRDIAAQQELADATYDHLITVSDLASGTYNLPDTFWFGDSANGIPNVVYVEGNLDVSGNRTVGGFIIVAGDILGGSAPDTDSSISGGTSVDGCILVVDDLKVSGGGGNNVVNINGGVWAGNLVLESNNPKDGLYINGNVDIIYNQEYMDAIKNMNPSNRISLISWREVRGSRD